MSSGSEFLCPRCKVPLKDVRTSGGVFYGCDVCGGRAVTIELLRKRFTPESINPLWLHAMRGEGRVGLPCPLCRQPMIGVALSDQAEVNVDVCKRCHFIWFDAHEVETLVPRQPEPVAPELPQKAREMLAIAEVERLAKQAEGPDLDSAAPDESWKQIAAFLGMPVEFDNQKSSEDRGQHGCFQLPSFAQVFVAFSNLREVVQRFGLIPAQATRLDGLTFVTSFSFTQASFILPATCIFCWRLDMPWKIFCDHCVISTLIAVAAFIGDLAHIALDPRSQTPCIGASGGIAGVITFYALNFPRLRLAFLMRWGFFWFRWIRLPAWFVFVLWFLFQIIGTLEQKAGMSSVSSAAHLGGAAVGVLALACLAKTQRRTSNARIAKASRNPNEKRLSFCVQHLISGPRSLRLSCVCGINQ